MSARQRAEIPPATDELLAAGQRKVGEGRLNLRALKPAGIDDAETERHVEEITHSYGAHAQIAPKRDKVSEPQEHAMEEPSPPPASAPLRRTRYASFRIDLPEYLDQELTERSARERATKTFLIMQALHRTGYTVKPEDLVADRRKTRFRQD
jgi:hypothetical protein